MPEVRLSAAMAPPAAAPPTTTGTHAVNCVISVADMMNVAAIFLVFKCIADSLNWKINIEVEIYFCE
jgi:hypothetical protein